MSVRLPDGSTEIGRLTTTTGRIVILLYRAADGSYGYRGERFGAWGRSLGDLSDALRGARCLPGGRNARYTGRLDLDC